MHFKNQNKLLLGALFCFLLAGVIFYYNNFKIPAVLKNTEASVRLEIDDKVMPKKKVAVVTSENGISRYTVLTQQVVKDKIKIIEIPVKYSVKGGVEDISEVIGKIAKEDLRCGEQIASDSISAERKWYGEQQRLKEYQVYGTVADEVKTGNIVDVTVNYKNGDYDIVLSKVKVIKLLKKAEAVQPEGSENETGTSVTERTDDLYATIILAVDETQYRNMELAKELGRFEMRLYIDENQPASKPTFNYNAAAARLKLSALSSKAQ